MPAEGGDARPVLRVVLVDDVDDLRFLLRTLFEPYPGVEVVGEAANGEEALTVVAATQPDLVVLDLSMPVLDGVSALPRLRRAAPAARVVVLSAIPPSADPGAMAAGAVAYVQKGAGKTARLVPDLLAAAGLLETTVTTLKPRSHQADLPATAASAGLARQFARQVLGSEGDDVLDTVQLLVSELVTNAVVHARSAPTVAIHLFDDHVHVEVLDDRTDEARLEDADSDAESGRGVALVDALSERWGSLTVEGGKIVWFDVGRAPLPH
jgi:DNA-binding NarL/FixJ family response regulator